MSWFTQVALTPIGPAVLYAIAGLCLAFPPVSRRSHVSQGIATAATLGAFAWTVVWLLLPVPVAGAFTVSPPELPPFVLRFAVSPHLKPVLAALALLGAVGAWERAPLSGPKWPAWAAGFLVLAGSLLVLVAANLPTVLLGWALADAGTILSFTASPRTEHRAAVGLRLGTLAAIWVVMLGSLGSDITSPWGSLHLTTWAHVALGVTVWTRLAAFPFPGSFTRDVARLPLLWSWVPLLAAAGWFIHWIQVPGSATVWGHPAWVVSAVLALTATALEAWLTRSPSLRLQQVIRQRCSMLLLVPWIWPTASVPTIAALVGTAVLAGSVWRMAEGFPFRARQIVRWFAAAWVWGAPGTLGSRWREVPLAVAAMTPLLIWATILAEAFVASALLVVGQRSEAEPTPRWGAAIPVGAFLIAWNVLAPVPVPLADGWWFWGTAIPLLLAIVLTWQYEALHEQLRSWKWILETTTRLQPLFSSARRALHWAALAVGGVTALVEGAGWFGWLLTAGLILWLWLRLWHGG